MGEDLRRSKLHSVYKRDSVEVSRLEPVPPKLSEEMSSVYEFPAVVDDEAELKKILGEQTWDTHTFSRYVKCVAPKTDTLAHDAVATRKQANGERWWATETIDEELCTS